MIAPFELLRWSAGRKDAVASQRRSGAPESPAAPTVGLFRICLVIYEDERVGDYPCAFKAACAEYAHVGHTVRNGPPLPPQQSALRFSCRWRVRGLADISRHRKMLRIDIRAAKLRLRKNLSWKENS